MEISLDELQKLDTNSYQLIDIRSEIEISHGILRGSIAIPADEIENSDKIDFSKKLVVCCNRGIVSVDVVKKLRENGHDAVSLKGGYIAWLMDEMERQDTNNICENAEQSIRKKFHKSIWSRFTKAINTYELVKEGDCIAVCISGGKDSMLLAKLFQELKRHSKFEFDVKYIVMDPGYSAQNRKVLEDNARNLNVPIEIFESDIFDAVFNIEKSPCYLCARMRRGHLYNFFDIA